MLPFSHIPIMFSSFGFCSDGMPFRMSSKSAGMSSVTRLTAAEYVPGSPLPSMFRSCPFCFAFSIHCLTTLSITYKAPSLWVAGAFLSARYKDWTMVVSACVKIKSVVRNNTSGLTVFCEWTSPSLNCAGLPECWKRRGE